MRRVVISLLALPWFLAFGYGAFALLMATGQELRLDELKQVVLGIGLFTYAFMAAIAVPALWVLLRLKRASLWVCIVVGALTGLTVLLVFGWPQLVDERLRVSFRLALIAKGYPTLLLGALAGGLFWLLALWRNPTTQRRKGKAAASPAAVPLPEK
jgi:hypothetical protein